MYRSCIFAIFACFIVTMSVMLGLAVGPIGFVLPTFLVLTVYLFLESLIIELIYLSMEDSDR
ncbi:MAG: hypothetical protein H6672_13010 [Anaerolineaceae bacterium]|nr:hypothetical protein [Anaerolineaceae bacterium]